MRTPLFRKRSQPVEPAHEPPGPPDLGDETAFESADALGLLPGTISRADEPAGIPTSEFDSPSPISIRSLTSAARARATDRQQPHAPRTPAGSTRGGKAGRLTTPSND